MSIDMINEIPALPKIDKDAVNQKGVQEVADYLIKLVGVLQENLIRTIINVVNIQLSLMNVGVFNFDLSDANGNYKSGDIRLVKTNGGVELQQYNGTTWTATDYKLARWER